MTTATPSDVRNWARAQGLTNAERGPLPRSVHEAYAAAHATASAAGAPAPRSSTALATRPASSNGASSPAPTPEALMRRLRVVEDQLADALSRLAALEANTTRSLFGMRVTL